MSLGESGETMDIEKREIEWNFIKSEDNSRRMEEKWEETCWNCK